MLMCPLIVSPCRVNSRVPDPAAAGGRGAGPALDQYIVQSRLLGQDRPDAVHPDSGSRSGLSETRASRSEGASSEIRRTPPSRISLASEISLPTRLITRSARHHFCRELGRRQGRYTVAGHGASPRASRAEPPAVPVFFLAQLVALVGTWMQTVSQAWLVLQLTNSPFKLGLLGTLQFGPILLLSPLAGVIADRWPQRRLLIATQATLACQAWGLALLVATGRARYWQIALLGLVTGLANTLDAPVRQSFVMSLVGREDLVNAVALNSASFNAARIVGPAVAGLLIARLGVVPGLRRSTASGSRSC